MPTKKLYHINVKQLALSPVHFAQGRPFVTNAQVKLDLDYTQRILAQAGIRVQAIFKGLVSPPQGVMIQQPPPAPPIEVNMATHGLSVTKKADGPTDLSDMTIALIGDPQPSYTDLRVVSVIDVYYANFLSADDKLGQAICEGIDLTGKKYPVILIGGAPKVGAVNPKTQHSYSTLAHEMVHTLQSLLVDPHWTVAEPKRLDQVNLMVPGVDRNNEPLTINAGGVFDSRRLVLAQVKDVLGARVGWLRNP